LIDLTFWADFAFLIDLTFWADFALLTDLTFWADFGFLGAVVNLGFLVGMGSIAGFRIGPVGFVLASLRSKGQKVITLLLWPKVN
jgi:hypothetical protein